MSHTAQADWAQTDLAQHLRDSLNLERVNALLLHFLQAGHELVHASSGPQTVKADRRTSNIEGCSPESEVDQY